MKNNNPGNIRSSSANWIGQTGVSDNGFVIFGSLKYGYRALYKLLDNYIKAGYDTIDKIINRWAPPADNNDTETYIKNVSKRTGLTPYEKVKKTDIFVIGLAISQQEHSQVDKEAAKDGISLLNIQSGKNDSTGSLLSIFFVVGIGLLFFKSK